MRKTSLLTLLIAALACIGNLNAQLDASLNLTGAYARNPQVGLEFGVSEKFGLGVDFGIPVGRYDITVSSGGSSSETSFKRSGVMASLMARYYFSPDAPTTGVYLAAYTRYRNFAFSEREIDGLSDPIDDLKNNRLSLGLGIGGKYLIGEKFFVDALVGGGFAPTRDNDLIDLFDDSLGFFDKLEAIDLFFRLSVGYRIF